MKLENIVCDIEYAKKLKELGVKQDSLFYWAETYTVDYINNGLGKREALKDDLINWLVADDDYRVEAGVAYSAFTCEELLKLLSDLYIEIELLDKEFRCEVNITNGYAITNKKISNALSRMLIYLIENKLITI